MTFRLVGLMSLVLLISLASFVLLMNHYQQEVRDEVTRTISRVGKATLSTLEYRFPPGGAGFDFQFATDGEGQHTLHPERDSVEVMEFRAGAAVAEIEDHGAWVRGDPGPGVGVRVVIVQRLAGELQGFGDEVACADVEEGVECEPVPSDGILSVEATLDAEEIAEVERSFFIHLDNIRADSDPARGTFLRIPTFHSAARAAHSIATNSRLLWDPSAKGSAPAATKQDIILPIATDDFDHLFAEFRSRTLFLSVGVFLLGTVLSASLATRFTRPVRRLDAGIRRLSEGDLEVQVEAHGRDEIGRLGRAFNEMARRLRSSKERERELTRREKLSALGRLAAGVAHDVRNPLHSIGLTLQHLREAARPSAEDRAREFDRSVDIIRHEVHRLDRLVSNFLRFARSDRRTCVAVDLSELLRETVRLVEKEAERRRIRVELVTDGEVRRFPADLESIRSSILNLVMNSFEAMKEGGTLSLKVRGGPDEVVLEVADTGCGIPEEDQERVFEFAYTTREDGHGLGLAMVHQVVVEDHGGQVSLDSRPGEGTRIRMAFPLVPAAGGA